MNLGNQILEWITPLSVLVILVALLYVETRIRKQNLSKRLMFVAVSESTSAVYLAFMSFNIFYQWATEATTLGYPFKLPNNSLFIAFCFFVLFLNTFSKKLKKPLHRVRNRRTTKEGCPSQSPSFILQTIIYSENMLEKTIQCAETTANTHHKPRMND